LFLSSKTTTIVGEELGEYSHMTYKFRLRMQETIGCINKCLLHAEKDYD